MLTIKETKERLIDFLYSRGVYMRPVTSIEFQTRCPYCGDSTKLNTGHLYLEIDTENGYNVPFFCQKCPASGVVTPDVLEMLGNTDEELRNGIQALNRRGGYKKGYNREDQYRYFERELPDEYRYPNKIAYLSQRMGIEFTHEELQEMKVVTSLYDFLLKNNIKTSPFRKEMRMVLERDYIGFLSSGNSHLLFRDTTGTHGDYPWIKYPIEEDCRRNRVFYGMESMVDILTEDPITINLSEGVMDAIGVCYHLDHHKENTFNIAICGQFYNTIIWHMIEVGAFGSNVTLNIFSDNDKNFTDHEVIGTSEAYQTKCLSRYRDLFKEINLYYNLKSKDYGTQKDKIIVKKRKI